MTRRASHPWTLPLRMQLWTQDPPAMIHISTYCKPTFLAKRSKTRISRTRSWTAFCNVSETCTTTNHQRHLLWSRTRTTYPQHLHQRILSDRLSSYFTRHCLLTLSEEAWWSRHLSFSGVTRMCCKTSCQTSAENCWQKSPKCCWVETRITSGMLGLKPSTETTHTTILPGTTSTKCLVCCPLKKSSTGDGRIWYTCLQAAGSCVRSYFLFCSFSL